MPMGTVEEAVEAIKTGQFVVIVDDNDRENEGDLAVAAEMVTPEAINFMAMYARGLVCMPIIGARLEELELPPMVFGNTARHRTAFTISVDAKKGVTTGISAADRATTAGAMIVRSSSPNSPSSPACGFNAHTPTRGVSQPMRRRKPSISRT